MTTIIIAGVIALILISLALYKVFKKYRKIEKKFIKEVALTGFV